MFPDDTETEPVGGNDPVLPDDPVPDDLPGTEGGVLSELAGSATYHGYVQTENVREANRLKNRGIRARLPPWTLVDTDGEGVEFRIVHFECAMINALQQREIEDVRRGLSWQRGRDLPTWGSIEVNARTMLHAIVECTAGTSVDLLGAQRANELRNDGVLYAFPSSTVLPGVTLRLLHMGHPYLHIVKADVTGILRDALGLKPRDELPVEVETEVERYMMIASIVGCTAGKQKAMRPGDAGKTYDVDLAELPVPRLRKWFVDELLPPANLRGRVPVRREDQVPYFAAMFENHNPDVIRNFRDAHRAVRTVENEKLLAYKSETSEFIAGADWERLNGGRRQYKVASQQLVNLKAMPLGELKSKLRETMFPVVSLMKRPPENETDREKYFRDVYRPFNNGFLEELLNREMEIREADWELILGKEGGFVAGLDASST